MGGGAGSEWAGGELIVITILVRLIINKLQTDNASEGDVFIKVLAFRSPLPPRGDPK